MVDVKAPQFPDDSRQVVRSFNADGSANFAQVGVEEIAYKGRFGALVTSTTEHDISIGEKYFVIDWDDGVFRTGDDILITSLVDPDCYMWGEVIDTDTVAEPLRLRVFVDDISRLTGTFAVWELQVVARPKPGIEKDTSLTSFDPADGGPWTLSVTADKFFPIGGTLLIKPTTDRSIALIGEVKAYSGTSLTVSLRSTNATVSQSYDSWSIALLDSPPAKLPQLSMVGLVIENDGLGRLKVNPGSVMDSTGTVLLTVDTAFVKTVEDDFAAGDEQGGVVRVQGAGTITSSGTTITGTGTNFTTFFTHTPLTDHTNQGSTLPVPVSISIGGQNYTVATIVDADTLTTFEDIGASSSAYYRNGTRQAGLTYATFYAVLIRKDSDGSIDVCFSTNTPSGEPDLPSGYTYYRVIGTFYCSGLTIDNLYIEQPLYSEQLPFAPNYPYYLQWLGTSSLPNARTLQSSTSVSASQVSPDKIEMRRAALTGDVTASSNSNSTTIANDVVSNAKLANMAAYTLKGRNAGTSGDPSDISIPSLTTKASPTTGDYVLITDGADANAFKKADVSTFSGGSGVGANYADYGLITDSPSSSVDYGTIV